MKSFLAWLCLLIVPPAALAAEDGPGWLVKINNAARELNYTGTFVYVEGRRIASMRVTHRASGGSMRQRIYSLNGAPREVIRNDEEVWCYVPDKKLGVHEYRQVSKQGFPNLLPRGLEHLLKYYDVYLGEEDRVADRPVQQIMVVPKDEFRYGYDLWADRDSGLLLKAALLDENKRPVEQYLFTTVQIGGDIPAEELEPMTPESELVWYGDHKDNGEGRDMSRADGDMPAANWVIAEAPEGFTLTRKIRRMSPMRSKMIEHYVFSDGLATVSVFVEDIEDEGGARVRGLNKMGAVHAYGREINGHQVTVVGEVPSATVDLIGKSVKPKEQ